MSSEAGDRFLKLLYLIEGVCVKGRFCLVLLFLLITYSKLVSAKSEPKSPVTLARVMSDYVKLYQQALHRSYDVIVESLSEKKPHKFSTHAERVNVKIHKNLDNLGHIYSVGEDSNLKAKELSRKFFDRFMLTIVDDLHSKKGFLARDKLIHTKMYSIGSDVFQEFSSLYIAIEKTLRTEFERDYSYLMSPQILRKGSYMLSYIYNWHEQSSLRRKTRFGSVSHNYKRFDDLLLRDVEILLHHINNEMSDIIKSEVKNTLIPFSLEIPERSEGLSDLACNFKSKLITSTKSFFDRVDPSISGFRRFLSGLAYAAGIGVVAVVGVAVKFHLQKQQKQVHYFDLASKQV